VTQEHGGIVKALNRGISEAKAGIIARMDADDVSRPERLSLQYEELSNNDSIALTSCLVEPLGPELTEGYERYIEWANRSRTHDEIIRDLYVESPLPHPTVMFRKEVVRNLGGYRDYGGPEDYDLWLRMAEAGCRFSKVPEKLLKWRVHPESLSRKDSSYRKRAFWARKLEYLADQLKNGRLAPGRKLFICGAGPASKLLRRHLRDNDIEVATFIDVAERKIGKTYQSLPVLPPDSIKKEPESFYLCSVNSWEARDRLKSFLSERELVAMEDYLML
jgi:glycosyltransferase involved in cell wall biosynthesis